MIVRLCQWRMGKVSNRVWEFKIWAQNGMRDMGQRRIKRKNSDNSVMGMKKGGK